MKTTHAKLISFYRIHKRMPSYSELAKLAGYKSKNAVSKLVDRLIKDGVVAKDGAGKLVPHRLFGEVRMLGLVSAGFPSAGEEELRDTMSLDEYLIENVDATYMLAVKGDSMIDAGIHEGDLVIVERGKQPRDGDIVIAEIDREWTMKFYRKKGPRVYLEPANKKYPLMFPEESLHIAAVVKAVVRKY
jgi:SOS regulatory protein LexA